MNLIEAAGILLGVFLIMFFILPFILAAWGVVCLVGAVVVNIYCLVMGVNKKTH